MSADSRAVRSSPQPRPRPSVQRCARPALRRPCGDDRGIRGAGLTGGTAAGSACAAAARRPARVRPDGGSGAVVGIWAPGWRRGSPCPSRRSAAPPGSASSTTVGGDGGCGMRQRLRWCDRRGWASRARPGVADVQDRWSGAARRPCAVVGVALQGDGDAVPLGQPAHHEQAHPARRVRGDVAAGAQGLVEVGERPVGDAEAGVLDLDP